MSPSLRKARESLRQTANLATGVCLGSLLAAPAFADTLFAGTDMTLDELQMSMLIGSLVLLSVSLALKVAKRRRAAPSVPTKQPARSRDFSEGIGRYRLQLGRGDAD